MAAGRIQVDAAGMEAAAYSCQSLASDLEECCTRLLGINAQLSEVYAGEAAESFYEFVTTRAEPILRETSEMCQEIGNGLTHTLGEFQEADQVMSGVFRNAGA